jgi:hypothetical protein
MQKHSNALEQKASLRALIETVESADYNALMSSKLADGAADADDAVDTLGKRRRSLD